MTPHRRMQRLLGYLPRALQEGENIRHFLYQVAKEMTLAEEGLTTLMRSRWYRLARGWHDPKDFVDKKVATQLGGIASLFGIEPLKGESTGQFRKRLRWLVDLHREGLTTAPVILKLAATVYLPAKLPTITWEGDIAVAELTVASDTGPRRIRLLLRDNPSNSARKLHQAVPPKGVVQITNASIEPAIPELHIRARDRKITYPQLTLRNNDLRIVYLGSLSPGQSLVLRHRQPPLLAGRPDTTPVIVYNPCSFNEDEAKFAVTRVDKGKPVLVGGRFSVFEPQSSLPTLPIGVSRWAYNTVDVTTLARYLGFWPKLKKFLHEPSTLPGPIDLEMRWQESRAACFELCVPPIVPLHMDGDLAALTLALRQAINYGRAAGVQARLTLTPPPVPDAVALADQLSVHIQKNPSDELNLTERLTVDSIGLELTDALASEPERFYASGKFGARTFDATLFDHPTKPEPETDP